MQIKLNPFPAVYYAVICEKHECRVEVRAHEERHPRTPWSSHGSLTTGVCEKGGQPLISGCEDSWVMTINTGGEVTVTS